MIRYIETIHTIPALLLLAFAAGTGSVEASVNEVRNDNYAAVSQNCREMNSGKVVRAIRRFEMNREMRNLIVDVDSLETRIVAPESLNCQDPSAETDGKRSRFQRALDQNVKEPYTLANDGIQHSATPVQGTFLTADLCPTLHGQFEHRLFDELEKIAARSGVPTPIALAVSGYWLKSHLKELQDILRLEATHKISVTWVNHSNTHPYLPTKDVSENFLLVPHINQEREVFGVEMKLLEQGLVPSVFFRFPGLISNENWIKTLNTYSLISVGSDAWLAKNQKAKSGSIILVHANGNEVPGIDKFLNQLPKIESIGPFLPLSKAL